MARIFTNRAGRIIALLILLSGLVYTFWFSHGRSGAKSSLPKPIPSSERLPEDGAEADSARAPQNDSWCEKWAVAAPLDSDWASEAVRRQVRMYDWCLVIVFEREPAETYDMRWFNGEGNKLVVTLTRENVKHLGDSKFVKACAWDHIGRKNIGYYYAVKNGAKMIWDFDDDNMLKFWIPGAAPPGAPSLDASIPVSDSVNVFEVRDHHWQTWNPYPAMGAPSLPSWPRGLPLDDATVVQVSNATLSPSTVDKTSIAVLQSLSDRQPDADALYQNIMPFPFYFKRMTMKTVMVPKHTLTPYNKQATLHFEASFWALPLLTTVDEDLSDIWRSYIGQRLFWEAGLRVGIIGRPLVVKDQNIHNSKDKTAIEKMYTNIQGLVDFLRSWRGKSTSLVERISELWLALSKNNFIGDKDVKLVDLWLQSLNKVRYNFLKLTNEKISSVPSYSNSKEAIALRNRLQNIYPSNVKKQRYTVQNNAPEYDAQVCDMDSTPDSLTFWNSDIHFASRLDQPTVLGELGHKVIIALGQKGGYCNPFVWSLKGIHLYNRISGVIGKFFAHVSHQNRRITEDMIIENFEFYKNDPEMASVDGFICLFQPGMCEMWMPFNKTIVFIPAHRYNMGRCSIEETKRLNEHLYKLASMDNPKHVISATSKYDIEYLRHYTDLEVLPLLSYCPYAANNTYAPTRDEIPIFVRKVIYHNWDNRFTTDTCCRH